MDDILCGSLTGATYSGERVLGGNVMDEVWKERTRNPQNQMMIFR